MIKEVTYSGHTAQPSDYRSPDGDLAIAINAIPEDGSIRPILPPETLFSVEDGQKVVYMHKSLNHENYILYGENEKLYWKDGKDGDVVEIMQVQGLKKITSSGKVLIASCVDGIVYFLFKDGAYEYMGNGVPSLPVYFSLNGQCKREQYTDSGLQVQRTGGGTVVVEGAQTLIFEQEIKAYSDGEATYVDVNIEAGERYRFYRPHYDAGSATKFVVYYVESNGTETYWTETSSSEWMSGPATKSCSRLKICLFFIPNSGMSYTSSTIQIFHREVTIITEPTVISLNKSLENFNAIMATCNRFIAICHDDNKFIFPFYVRYSLVLYDGTESQVSPPILMIPNYKKVPFLPFRFTNSTGYDVTIHASAIACELRMHIQPNELKNWTDIISGVNIYATSPLFTYDQAATYEEWSNNMNVYESSSVTLDSLFSISSEKGNFVGKSVTQRYKDFVGSLPENYIDIPLKSDEEISKELAANQSYRKIKSYTIDEIIRMSSVSEESIVDIKLEKGTLNTINTLPEMSSSGYVFNKMFPSDIFSYNNRLIVSTNSERMFEGYSPLELNGYYDDGSRGYYFVEVHIGNIHNGNNVVKTMKINSARPYVPIHWFYYPNPNAVMAKITKWIYDSDTGKYKKQAERVIKLTPHDYLPGVYWQDFGNLIFIESAPSAGTGSTSDEEMDASQINSYLQPLSDSVSKIHVSEVNNPFVFSPENTITVGFGEILALSAAVKALSEGQFGQFPLYAFTTEGIWALEVSSTGTFSARQPITRDVCNNPQSITQTDTAVLFSADRGIMLLSGSQFVCISDTIDSVNTFAFDSLPYGHIFRKVATITEISTTILPLREFLAECRMLYDYPHQRIIVFNADKEYAYVFSLKSKMWGMMESNLASTINAYPEAIAMNNEGHVVNFGITNEDKLSKDFETKFLILTRPLKLDMPDIHKTVNSIIQHGYFKKGHVQTILYGSRDLHNWHLVWSSKDHCLRGFRGTPYKYFRIALVGHLMPYESISGASVQFTPRLTNQPR